MWPSCCQGHAKQELDAGVSKEDQERLLESLREWGALDKNFAYVAREHAAAIGAAFEAIRAAA